MDLRVGVLFWGIVVSAVGTKALAQSGTQIAGIVAEACQAAPPPNQPDPRSALESLTKIYSSMAASTVSDAQRAGATADTLNKSAKAQATSAGDNFGDDVLAQKATGQLNAAAEQAGAAAQAAQAGARALQQDGAQIQSIAQRAPTAFESDKLYICYQDNPGSGQFPPNSQNDCDACPSNDASAIPNPNNRHTRCDQCKKGVGSDNKQAREACVQKKQQEMMQLQQLANRCAQAAGTGQGRFAKNSNESLSSQNQLDKAASSTDQLAQQNKPQDLQSIEPKYDYGNGQSGYAEPTAENTQGGVLDKNAAPTQNSANASPLKLYGQVEQNEFPQPASQASSPGNTLTDTPTPSSEAALQRQSDALASVAALESPNTPNSDQAPTFDPYTPTASAPLPEGSNPDFKNTASSAQEASAPTPPPPPPSPPQNHWNPIDSAKAVVGLYKLGEVIQNQKFPATPEQQKQAQELLNRTGIPPSFIATLQKYAPTTLSGAIQAGGNFGPISGSAAVGLMTDGKQITPYYQTTGLPGGPMQTTWTNTTTSDFGHILSQDFWKSWAKDYSNMNAMKANLAKVAGLNFSANAEFSNFQGGVVQAANASSAVQTGYMGPLTLGTGTIGPNAQSVTVGYIFNSQGAGYSPMTPTNSSAFGPTITIPDVPNVLPYNYIWDTWSKPKK